MMQLGPCPLSALRAKRLLYVPKGDAVQAAGAFADTLARLWALNEVGEWPQGAVQSSSEVMSEVRAARGPRRPISCKAILTYSPGLERRSARKKRPAAGRDGHVGDGKAASMSGSRGSNEAGQYKAMGSRARLDKGIKRNKGGEAAVLRGKGAWARCEMGRRRHGRGDEAAWAGRSGWGECEQVVGRRTAPSLPCWRGRAHA